MTEEQLKAKSNAILDKLEEEGFDLGDWSIEDAHNNGFIDGYHEGFKDCAKSRLNVTTISDCPAKDEEQLEYARTIIQDLLSNSDEYARQRAIDFLKESE